MRFNTQIRSSCCCCILEQEISFALLQSARGKPAEATMVVVRFLERNTWLTLLQPTQLFNMGTCYLLGKVAGLICWPLDPQEYLQTLFVDPDHLCFDRTTYDNINGPAGPLMYPDQISRYIPYAYGMYHTRTD